MASCCLPFSFSAVSCCWIGFSLSSPAGLSLLLDATPATSLTVVLLSLSAGCWALPTSLESCDSVRDWMCKEPLSDFPVLLRWLTFESLLWSSTDPTWCWEVRFFFLRPPLLGTNLFDLAPPSSCFLCLRFLGEILPLLCDLFGGDFWCFLVFFSSLFFT